MTTPSPELSYGRGQIFTHDQEIANFILNNGNTVLLTANHGSFLLEMRDNSEDAWQLEYNHLDSLHEAMLATRQMAHDHGGVPTAPRLADHEPGHQLLTEEINGFTVILERSEAAEDLYWDVYALEAATGKTGDVQSFEENEYLLALNAYDEIYFEIECDNDPTQ